MGLLIVFAALAGYHWGVILDTGGTRIFEHDVLLAAGTFTILAVLCGLWVESAVTRSENQVALAQRQHETKSKEADISNEKARELDRIVSRLSEDNADLREKLLSSKIREVREDPANGNHGAKEWRAWGLG